MSTLFLPKSLPLDDGKLLTEEWIELFPQTAKMISQEPTVSQRDPTSFSSSVTCVTTGHNGNNQEPKTDGIALTPMIPGAQSPDTITAIEPINTAPEDLENNSDHRARLTSGAALAADFTRPALLLPPAKYRPWVSKLRFEILSVYMRLYTMIILANIIAIIALATAARPILLQPRTSSNAAAINITISILLRHDVFTNLLFIIFGCCPQWVPLRIRRLTAKIYHFGGMHSGAGISALIWVIVFSVVLVKSLVGTHVTVLQQVILALTALLDVLIVTIIASSHPRFRTAWHNTWENLHRYGGWTAVGAFWVLFGLEAIVNRRLEDNQVSIGSLLIQNPGFWLLILITLCIIWPWIWLRKVAVRPEILSDHAIRLHFLYMNLPLCAAPRITDAPMKEWHSFAGIPHRNGPGFSLLVSKAGDWTTKIIENPPTKLWVRGLPVRGVLHIAPIFKKTVLVATGSGIGPVMSLLVSRDVNCRILWSTRNPKSTYGDRVIAEVLRVDPNAVIINTTDRDRPNMAEESYRLYHESGAEAIFVISNPKVCRAVVPELEKRGIPTFAPVFDS